MTVDLLVVNYNTKDLLKRLLQLLMLTDDFSTWKLYVADNGSTDGSADFLKLMAGAYRIEEVHFNENIGYGRAINKLAAKGTSEYLAALNADVWLTTDDVKKIVQTFESYPDAAVIGPKQRDEKHRIRHCGIMWENNTFQHRAWGVFDPEDRIHRNEITECGTVSGSAYFMRRRVWDEMTNCPILQKVFPGVEGSFLPTDLYFEETGNSRHCTAHGYKILYDGTVSIGHSWAASTPEGNQANADLVPQSRAQYVTFCQAHDIEIESNLMQ